MFLFLNQNICCGYSKEPSQWDGSFEHSKHMLKFMGKKIFTILRWQFLFIETCYLITLPGQTQYWCISWISWVSNGMNPDLRPNNLSGLIWVQTVCQSYQETTQEGNELTPTTDAGSKYCYLKVWSSLTNSVDWECRPSLIWVYSVYLGTTI